MIRTGIQTINRKIHKNQLLVRKRVSPNPEREPRRKENYSTKKQPNKGKVQEKKVPTLCTDWQDNKQK